MRSRSRGRSSSGQSRKKRSEIYTPTCLGPTVGGAAKAMSYKNR